MSGDSLKQPKISIINHPELLALASKLPKWGALYICDNGYCYLKVKDEYIHDLSPLLKKPQIKKPNYFVEGSVGAHISVVYPDENQMISEVEVGVEHEFAVTEIAAATIGAKIYYVLLVRSPTLLTLRKRFGLSNELNFKGYAIGLHITIGVEEV